RSGQARASPRAIPRAPRPPTPGCSATSRSRPSGSGTRRDGRSHAEGRAPPAWRAESSGSAPACRAERPGSARLTASRRPRRADRRRRPSDEPLPVLLDGLAVQLDPAAAAELLDHVPMDGALVRPAQVAESLADGAMDRALDLLVEEGVAHVVLDAGVAADAELAEPPRPRVCVQHPEEEL